MMEQLKRACTCVRASAFRRLRMFISEEVMVRVCKAYVLSHLEYFNPHLLGIGNGETTKMENTNYYLLRSLSHTTTS